MKFQTNLDSLTPSTELLPRLTSAQVWLNTPQVGYAMLGKVRTRYVGHPDKVCGNRLWVDSDVSDICGVTDVLRKVWKRAP